MTLPNTHVVAAWQLHVSSARRYVTTMHARKTPTGRQFLRHVCASLCQPQAARWLLHWKASVCRAAGASSTATSQQGYKQQEVLQQIAVQQEQAATRPPRFYVPHKLERSDTVLLDGDEGRHAVRALRLREGDNVQLCDGRGGLAMCTITALDKGRNKAWLEMLEPPILQPWEGPQWCLAAACTTLKGGRAEWLVEKATELGAAEFIPVTTARSQPAGPAGGNKYRKAGSPSDAEAGTDYQPSRMERVAIAATKQSLRAHVMKLHAPTDVTTLSSMVQQAEVALLAVAGAPPLQQALRAISQLKSGQDISQDESCAGNVGSFQNAGSMATLIPASQQGRRLLLVGPEGDWTPEELETLIIAGAKPVGLGGNRLRAETAAVALLSAVLLLEA